MDVFDRYLYNISAVISFFLSQINSATLLNYINFIFQ